MKKPALSQREIETLKLLKENLSGYEIYPNMRLADVIKADWRLFNRIGKYHLDFVICDHQANVIAAIELDDSTHDNQKARERDAKKDEYLRSADIKLFRIRLPHEVIHVATLIKGHDSKYMDFNQIDDVNLRSRHPVKNNVLMKIAVSIFGMLVIWMIFNYMTQSFVKHIVERNIVRNQQDIEKLAKPLQQSSALSGHVSIEPSVASEKVFVKGRAARECQNRDKALDNSTVLCMTDHFEMVQHDQALDQKLLQEKNEQRNVDWNKFYKEPLPCLNPAAGEETRVCLVKMVEARKVFYAEWDAKHSNP